MIMADVFTVVFLILGFWLALPALCLLVSAAAPGLVSRAQQRVALRPGLALLIGLAVVLPALFGIAAGAAAGAKPLALLAAGALSLFCFVGVSGLAGHLGCRLGADARDDKRWLATLRGAACLTIAGSLPIVGWLLVWPVALVMGAGAATLALLRRRAPVPVGQAAAVAEPSPQTPQQPGPALTDEAAATPVEASS